jgi:hypothetical protein
MFQGSFPSLKGGTVAQEQHAAAETARVSKLPNASLHNLDFDTDVRIIKMWDGAGNLGRRGKLQDRNCESARYPFDIYVGTYICYKDRRLGLTIVYQFHSFAAA